MPETQSPPVALTIAGSDNSAGAGAQADLKTFTALGVYGLTAITCVVAEVPGRVSAIHPVPPEIVAGQVRLSLGAFPVAAIKTGMLFSAEIVRTVCDLLDGTSAPVVVDPVMVATSGDRLLQEEAVALYRERLFPRAALVTPNMDEAAVLLGRPVRTIGDLRAAGYELAAHYRTAWLLKGGHLGGDDATDLLFPREGAVIELPGRRVHGVRTHGTGCATSAAIAAGLAAGLALEEAARRAKDFVGRAIAGHYRWAGIDALRL